MDDYTLVYTYLAAVRRRYELTRPAKPRALRRALRAADVIEAALWREYAGAAAGPIGRSWIG